MKLEKTTFNDLYIVHNKVFKDERGEFFKPFEYKFLKSENTIEEIVEIYYSKNRKGVIRGMHFQIPPADHMKLVWVSNGKILDVAIDLRKSSGTYGQYFSTTLASESGRALLIGKGFAHGFLSLEDETVVNYAQTSGYSPAHDQGIRFDSFGFPWPESASIISERDLNFPDLGNYISEFV